MIKEELLAKVLKFKEQGWTDEQIEKAMPANQAEIRRFLSIVKKITESAEKAEAPKDLLARLVNTIDISNYERISHQRFPEQNTQTGEKREVPTPPERKGGLIRKLLFILAIILILGGLAIGLYVIFLQ